MPKLLKLCLLLFIAVFVVGCGGGGGEASSKTSTTATTATYSLALAVVDANNNVVNGITYGGGQKIRATYTDANGNPVKQTLVSFSVSTNSSAAALAYAYVTTNDSGIAYDPLSPATATTSGAATVSATAGKATSAVDFSISGSTVTIGNPVLGSASLAASGTTSVRVLATANSTPASGVTVAFSADCGTVSPATSTTSGDGYASSSYSAVKADGTSCSGTVKIYAAASGNTTNSSLTVASPTASAINFISATPAQIYVTGSGASSQSVLRFKVLDASGAAYSGAAVTASLTENNPGGLGLNAVGSTGTLSLTSDGSGVITFTVFAGSIPGPVEVKAALTNNAAVYALSKNLSVQYGPPSQDHFSISVGTFNVEGNNRDGTTSTITARLADRQGNAVPAGTVVNFTASGGQIGASCPVTLSNGIASCTTTFSSQAPRASNGRVAVLAYAEGLKNYVDNNANNSYDTGYRYTFNGTTYTNDTLSDMGDAYRDDNENGQWDSGEFVIARGGSTTCSGSGWPTPSRVNSCTGTVDTTVRKQVVLIMSGSTATFNASTSSINAISFRLNDNNSTSLNPMPYGTTVSATAIDNTSSNSLSCTVVSALPAVVPNIGPDTDTSKQLGTDHTVSLSGCAVGDQVRVTVTTPLNVETTKTYDL